MKPVQGKVRVKDLKHCRADVQEAGQIFVMSGWILQKVCTQLCLCGCSTGGVDEKASASQDEVV